MINVDLCVISLGLNSCGTWWDRNLCQQVTALSLEKSDLVITHLLDFMAIIGILHK